MCALVTLPLAVIPLVAIQPTTAYAALVVEKSCMTSNVDHYNIWPEGSVIE